MGIVILLLLGTAVSEARLDSFWHGDRSSRRVALTFDDGPFEPYTTDVLKVLKQYNVTGTFFVIGLHTRKWPEVIDQILKEGHELANHTETHSSLAQANKQLVKDEIWSLQDYLKKTFGVEPRFFRPPHGNVNYATLTGIEEAGMDLIFWDVDPQDWDSPGVLNIAKTVARQVKPGSILLLHTINPQTVETLPVLIEYLKLDRYEIVPLSELIGRHPYIQDNGVQDIVFSNDSPVIRAP